MSTYIGVSKDGKVQGMAPPSRGGMFDDKGVPRMPWASPPSPRPQRNIREELDRLMPREPSIPVNPNAQPFIPRASIPNQGLQQQAMDQILGQGIPQEQPSGNLFPPGGRTGPISSRISKLDPQQEAEILKAKLQAEMKLRMKMLNDQIDQYISSLRGYN